MPESSPARMLNLPSLGLSLRVLFTGYLVVVPVGLAVSGVQILLTHGMADGQFGLSVDDIVYSYYGNRGSSRLEIKLNGTMKDKADEHDRAAIIKWVRLGSPRDGWDQGVSAVVAHNCVKCHGVIPGLPSFTTYEGIKPLAKFDEGATVDGLTRVSHIHLFGIAFIFFFVCAIFSLSVGVPAPLKAAAIGMPFLFLLLDLLSWWLTRWYPSFAYLTIAGGFTYNAAAGFMIVTSLYQMWILPRSGRVFATQPWLDE